jgi:hypothetical protein
MTTSISQYYEYPRDGQNQPLPVGTLGATNNTVANSTGSVALASTTRFVRIATDTAIYVDIGAGAATGADLLVPAGAVEFFAVPAGSTVQITPA